MPYSPIVFTFDDMITSLKSAMRLFPDTRTGKNTQYEIIDAALGAFSVFFTQCPSFLSHQKLMEQKYGLSNAKALFGMRNIPSDTHIRDLLDKVSPSLLSHVFQDCFSALKKSGDLDTFRVRLGKDNNDLLLALDGTQYFSSDSITCKNCSKKVKDGERIYSHSMVTPTIVAPGVSKVISLAPSFVTPQDGDKKQDCEIKASKRWMSGIGKLLSSETVTILGDDLYAHEPFCKDILDQGMHFILVCKQESHKTVYEWIKGITREVTVDRFDGRTHQVYKYQYVEGVPLTNGEDALMVNFVAVTVTDRKTRKQLYHNAWITSHSIEGGTKQETEIKLGILVDCGRARWKIENENNNTLKTQGYHLEHNFGHGKRYLASLFAVMNLLAFLFHTMLEFMDDKYRLLRKIIGARETFFNHIRTLLLFHPYKSFSSFMDFMIEGLKRPIPIEELHYPL